MRLRNLKNKDSLLTSCSYLINNPGLLKSKWAKEFGNENPIHLEIGMGKGDFIYQMALNNPSINFIGLEKYSGVMARAIKKYPTSLPNLRLIILDAKNLTEVFAQEISTIYLNFSDPWPKERHALRRLTSSTFLKIYDQIFICDALIIQKTDNLTLFASSLVSLSTYGYVLSEVCLDLASSNIPTVLSEYEKKFRAQNIKINYLVAKKKKA